MCVRYLIVYYSVFVVLWLFCWCLFQVLVMVCVCVCVCVCVFFFFFFFFFFFSPPPPPHNLILLSSLTLSFIHMIFSIHIYSIHYLLHVLIVFVINLYSKLFYVII